MKLIIDIPEEIYIEKKEDYIGDTLDRAIVNGTPLEEELKKIKEEVLEGLYDLPCDFNYGMAFCTDILDKHISELKGENNGKERTMKVDLDKMADRVAEKALDEFTYNGKTLREWIEIIVAQDLLAITELEKVKTEVCEPNEMEYFENSNVWQKWFCNLIDKRIAELKGKNNE